MTGGEADRQATAADVVACYEKFLGRQPEDPKIINAHLSAYPHLWDLIVAVHDSQEAQRRRIQLACALIAAEQDARGVAVEASPSETAQLTDHIRRVWSRYGREEAYFSVLTDPAYLRERLGVADLEAFYATGHVEVRRFENVCRRNGIEPVPAWSICELGCGVGRVGEAFAKHYRAYAGVDISPEHLAIARARLAERALENARWASLDEFQAGALTYDVFFSMIVLQHNTPPIMRMMLERGLQNLEPGGIAYFQVPCHLYDYRFSVAGYLAGEGRLEEMELHALPQREVFELLARHALVPLEVTPDDRIGPSGISYTFLARKERTSPS
jgi:SAM-dependent methyltransferase